MNRAGLIAVLRLLVLLVVLQAIYPGYRYASRQIKVSKAERDFVAPGLGYAIFEYAGFECGIVFEGEKVTDDSLLLLNDYPDVDYLQLLYTTRVTDAGLSVLRGCRKLRSLVVDHCPQITDEGLRAIEGLPELYAIHVLDARLGDRTLAVCATLPRLESLVLSAPLITDDGLRELGACPGLANLALEDTRLTGTGFFHLPSGKLRHLEVASSAPRFTLSGIEHLESLESLDVRDCKVDESEFGRVARLKRLKRVEGLSLDR